LEKVAEYILQLKLLNENDDADDDNATTIAMGWAISAIFSAIEFSNSHRHHSIGSSRQLRLMGRKWRV